MKLLKVNGINSVNDPPAVGPEPVVASTATRKSLAFDVVIVGSPLAATFGTEPFGSNGLDVGALPMAKAATCKNEPAPRACGRDCSREVGRIGGGERRDANTAAVDVCRPRRKRQTRGGGRVDRDGAIRIDSNKNLAGPRRCCRMSAPGWPVSAPPG